MLVIEQTDFEYIEIKTPAGEIIIIHKGIQPHKVAFSANKSISIVRKRYTKNEYRRIKLRYKE